MLTERRDHFVGKEFEMRLDPARRQPRWQRPGVKVSKRYLCGTVTDHLDTRVYVYHIEHPELPQMSSVPHVRDQRHPGFFRLLRIAIHLIDDVISRLVPGFLRIG